VLSVLISAPAHKIGAGRQVAVARKKKCDLPQDVQQSRERRMLDTRAYHAGSDFPFTSKLLSRCQAAPSLSDLASTTSPSFT
jgi:hypothetical protein